MGSAACNLPVSLKQEGSTDYTLRIEESIENIAAQVWNRQVPASNLLMQYDYLKLIETSQKQNLGFRYMLVKQSDQVVGALYFQIIHFAGYNLINYFPADLTGWKNVLLTLVKNIVRPLIANLRADMLVTGNIFMTGESGFYFSDEISPPVQAALLREAIHHVVSSHSNIKAAVVSDIYEPKTLFDTDFKSCDFHEVKLEPDMSLAINSNWHSFNDYLNSFSSKYRVRAKKVFSVNEANKIEQRELNGQDIEKYQDDLYRLYLNIMDKADFKLGVFTKEYFALQKKQMPENYRLFAYFKGDQLLGFISAFISSKKMDVHYVGMDKEANKEIHLYQRMMYDMVALSIELKLQHLHLGRTAPEIKSTIGATPVDTFGYIKHFNPLINYLIIRPVMAAVKPREYVFRNPFKTA